MSGRERTMEIWLPGGSSRAGLGCLIGRRLILAGGEAASAHAVLAGLAGSRERFAARRVWPEGNGPVCLLYIDDKSFPVPGEAARWGVLTSRDAWVEALAAGDDEFPLRLNNLAVGPGGHWEPRPGHDLSSPLAGLEWPAAGAPVHCGQMLVGILVWQQTIDGEQPVVVQAARLARDGGFRQAVHQYDGDPVVCEPVELADCLRRWLPAAPPAVPSALLAAERAIAPWQGRDWMVEDLIRWCEGPQLVTGRLLVGAHGQGKRRLARHVADAMRSRGWAAGEVVSLPPAGWPAAVARSGLPVLLLLDGARQRQEQFLELHDHLVTQPPIARVRLLLLESDADGWWTGLGRRSPELGAMFTRLPEPIGELEPSPGTLGDAALAYAATFRAPRPAVPTGLEWIPPGPGKALSLQIAALAMALDGQPAGGREPQDVVFDHEIRTWERAADRLSPQAKAAWRPAMAAALLFGASTEGVAVRTLSLIPGIGAGLGAQARLELADWIRGLYPPEEPRHRFWGTLRSASLTRRYLATAIDEYHLLEAMLPSVEQSQVRQALEHLIRLPYRDTLAGLLQAHPQILGPDLVGLASREPEALALVQSFLHQPDAAELQEKACLEMLQRISDPAGPLTGVKQDLLLRLISRFEPAAQEGGRVEDAVKLARHLCQYAESLAEEGKHSEAVRHCRRATEVYGRLTASGPHRAAYFTAFAESLLLLASQHAQTGRLDEASGAAKQAADVFRTVAGVSDPRLRTRLASTLELLAEYAVRAGEVGTAVAALKEATAINRTEVSAAASEVDAVAILERLVAVATRLAEALSSQGDREAATAARREVVAVARRLVRKHSSGYRRILLAALQALADSEFAAGRQDQGIDALREAAVFWRDEAGERSTKGLAGLARATRSLSDRLAGAGRQAEALEAAIEAVETANRLDDPALTMPTHLTLAYRHAEQQRWAEAAAVLHAASQTARRCLSAGDTAYLIPLATALTNLSAALVASGDYEGTWRAAHEALEVLDSQRIPSAHPAAHPAARIAAAAYTNAALTLAATGRRDEALRTIERGVELFDGLPGTTDEEEARALAILRDLVLTQRGAGAALEIAESVVAKCSQLVQADEHAHRARHAIALHELARCQMSLERWERAVTVAQNAQAEYDMLGEEAEAFREEQADLALLVFRCLTKQGHSAKARIAAERAVDFYRQLAGEAISPVSVRLADALDIMCEIDGTIPAGIVEEAVVRRRPLAQNNKPEQIARLSAALRRHARRCAAEGRLEEGKRAAQEALAESRRLEPALAAPEVALSLQELSWHLEIAGDEHEGMRMAVEAAAESVAGYRMLARDGAEGYRRQLIVALIDLSYRQRNIDDPMAAFLSAEEAVRILAEANSQADPDQQLLADALTALELSLLVTGPEDRWLKVVEEKVAIYRSLSDKDPAYLAAYAAALRSMAETPAGRRTRKRRIEAAREAIEIYRRLAAADRAFEAELEAAQRTHARLHRKPWQRPI